MERGEQIIMKLLKNVIRIIVILLFIICLMYSSYSYAMDVSSSLGDLNSYGQTTQNSNTFENMVGKFITIIQTVGSIISVICLIIIGIKYMIGSVEQKAEYKKVLLPYVIGASLVFATTNLLGIIYSVITGLE